MTEEPVSKRSRLKVVERRTQYDSLPKVRDGQLMDIGHYRKDLDPRSNNPVHQPPDKYEVFPLESAISMYLSKNSEGQPHKSPNWEGGDFGKEMNWPRGLVEASATALQERVQTLCDHKGQIAAVEQAVRAYTWKPSPQTMVDPAESWDSFDSMLANLFSKTADQIEKVEINKTEFKMQEASLHDWITQTKTHAISQANKSKIEQAIQIMQTVRQHVYGGEKKRQGTSDRTAQRYRTFLAHLSMIKDYHKLIEALDLGSTECLEYRKDGKEGSECYGRWNKGTAKECAALYDKLLTDMDTYPFNGTEEQRSTWRNTTMGCRFARGETSWATPQDFYRYLNAHGEESSQNMSIETMEWAGVGGNEGTLLHHLVRHMPDKGLDNQVVSVGYLKAGSIVGFVRGHLFYGSEADTTNRIHVVNGVFFEPKLSYMYPIFSKRSDKKANIRLVYQTVPDPIFGKGPGYRIAAITIRHVAPLTVLTLG